MAIKDTDIQIKKLTEEIARLKELSNLKDQVIDEKKRTIDNLTNTIYWLRKKIFGKMSERITSKPDSTQLDLFGEDLSNDEEKELEKEKVKEEKEIKKATKRKARKIRDKNPSWKNLPVVEEIIDSKEKDDIRYKSIGEEITYKLAILPRKVYVKKIIRIKYALTAKTALTQEAENLPSVVIAPVPISVIPKGLADTSLLTDIILEKYLYHMPFYRQVQRFKNMGLTISSSTIGDWFSSVCELIKPLYDELRKEVLSTNYIQIDESTLPVIDNEKHRAVKGYIWVVNDPMNKNVFFYYDGGSRSERIARILLKDFKGAVQSDGYQVYNKFENQKGKIMLGCWSHARRKFFDALQDNEQLANYAIDKIRLLYEIESEAEENNLSFEERQKLRNDKSWPILEEFEDWLQKKYVTVLPKSIIGKAIAYTYSIYPKLVRYIMDGRYQLDNNLVENAIRILAVGRKNYMFCGNNEAAIKAAIMYSLIGTCKASNINPVIWFNDILNKMLEYIQNNKDITELLPNNWQKTQNLLESDKLTLEP